MEIRGAINFRADSTIVSDIYVCGGSSKGQRPYAYTWTCKHFNGFINSMYFMKIRDKEFSYRQQDLICSTFINVGQPGSSGIRVDKTERDN